MMLRILTVREHKSVIFCDICTSDAHREQLLVEKELFPDINLKVGDVLDCAIHIGLNRRGESVAILDEVISLYGHTNFSSYKSFSENSKQASSGELQSAKDNFLNGGSALSARILRNSILEFVESYMKERDVCREYTPITTPYRGTSIAAPQRAEGVYTGHKYIKITHELGLKIACYLMLKSVYEIGYVCRDRYDNQTNLNEFLTIEGVILSSAAFSLDSFFYDIWGKAIETSDRLGIDVSNDFKDIVHVDFIKEYGKKPLKKDAKECLDFYEGLMSTIPHMIITNAPIDSPFVLSSEGEFPTETKWIFHGKGIGHGYPDEYRFDSVINSFEEQKLLLKSKNIESDLPIDYLNILSSAGFPTLSFAVGIERLVGIIMDNIKIR